MNLNVQFKQAIIEDNYFYSVFDGKIHDINDLQVCHILSKSKRTINCIKKAYGCSDKTADILMNMPLLNTVIGTRQDNAEYKKTDDIVYIDRRLITIVYNLIIDNQKHFVSGSRAIYDFYILLGFIKDKESIFISKNFENYINDKNNVKDMEVLIFTGLIKDIQCQFHKEIDLHI